MIDYSLLADAAGRVIQVPIIRSYPWPAGGRTFTLRLIRDDGWTEGVEDAWTWRLQFDDRMVGGAALVTAVASAAIISGPAAQYLDLSFALTAGETADLAGAGRTAVLVDLESEDAQHNKSIWPEAHGRVSVRSAVGGGL